eukprot:scaffold85184_cov52-Phaeocystis_antarctica.AAC.1
MPSSRSTNSRLPCIGGAATRRAACGGGVQKPASKRRLLQVWSTRTPLSFGEVSGTCSGARTC